MNGRNAALDKRAWAWATYGTTIEIGLCMCVGSPRAGWAVGCGLGALSSEL